MEVAPRYANHKEGTSKNKVYLLVSAKSNVAIIEASE